MSDKCTPENLTWLASVDVWKCSDCMKGLSKQEVIYIKSKQLKETQEQLEALRAENKSLSDAVQAEMELKATARDQRDRMAKELEALKAKNEKLMAKIHEKADLFEADGDLIRKLTDDIESLKAEHVRALKMVYVPDDWSMSQYWKQEYLKAAACIKADKAKVEAEAIRKAAKELQVMVDRGMSALAWPVLWLSEYASQLETKEK